MKIKDLKKWYKIKRDDNEYKFICIWENKHWVFELKWKYVIMHYKYENILDSKIIKDAEE